MPILYNFGVFFIKLSILLLYQRLFGHEIKLQRWIIGLIAFQACYTVGFSLVLAFICTPAKAWWELSLRADHCPSFPRTMAIYVSLRSISVFTEVVVLCLPIRIVWGLMMPVNQRVKLVVLFLLGLMYVRVLPRSRKVLIWCEGLASLLWSDWPISRGCFSALISHVCPPPLMSGPATVHVDGIPGNIVPVALLGEIELFLGIFAASLPALATIYKR